MRNVPLLLLTALLMTAPALLAQQPPAANQPMPMPAASPSAPMPPMDCQAMMQKMQASSKAMDDRLAALVNDMNNATGSAKVDRMAAVIAELVAQRKQMRDDMAAMMPQMMNHMQHMHSGAMSGMEAMADCPMMKGGSHAPAPPAPEHKH